MSNSDKFVKQIKTKKFNVFLMPNQTNVRFERTTKFEFSI